MNGLRGDNVVLDVLENDQTWIYGLDKRLEDRQAWVARLKKRLVMADTISYVGGTVSAANGDDEQNGNTWEPSIYRIPACIREVDPAAYEPQVLSLGPYHHGKPKLRAMDELKWCYLRRFLRRNPEKDLDDYLTLVEELESQARSAYSELEPPVDSKEFVQMMLLDCCFLLEFLPKYVVSGEQEGEGAGEEDEGKEEADVVVEEEEEADVGVEEEEEELMDPIRTSAWATPFVLRDILLLENQLPFFLLERLLKWNIPCQTPSLPQSVLGVFWDLMPGKIRKTPTGTNGAVGNPIHHILHLMYSCAIPIPVPEDNPKSSSPASLSCLFKMLPRGASRLLRQAQKHSPGGSAVGRVASEEPTLNWIPCAKKLREAGVEFKRKKGDMSASEEPTLNWIPCAKKLREAGVEFKRKKDYMSFLEVTFDKGVMEIPPLQIFGYIDSVFRNLIAFEQCHTSNHSPFYVSAYAYLMDLVVDTAADVQLLKQEGIIVSTLGSDEDVALLFNQLRKNTTIDDSYLASVFNSIQIHCDKRTNRWKASLNHNYLHNPWAKISVGAAFLLFILTITQTVLAFFSYLRPTSG